MPITNPTGSGQIVTVTAGTGDSKPCPYTVGVPKGGSVTVGGKTYANADANNPVELTVSVDDDGNPVVVLVSGTADVSGDSVSANGVTVSNNTGIAMTVALNEDSTLSITVNGETLTYTRPSGDAPVALKFRANGGDGTLNAELTSSGESLTVPAGTGINIYNSDSAEAAVVAVTKDGGNQVTVTHTDTTAYKAEVAGTTNSATEVKVGKDTYTVPAKTTSVLTTDGKDAIAKLTQGAVGLDKNSDGNGFFVPDDPITRAEAATMVQRYCEAFEK